MWFDRLTTNEINYLPFVLSKDLFRASLKEIGCKFAWPVHISPLFWARERLLPCKIVKICPHPAKFSLRFFKSDRLLALHLPAIWIQEGIVHEAAARRAQAGGMTVAMDRCILKDYVRLFTA